MPEFFDTHAHLNDAQFDPDREEVLSLSLDRGVTRVIEIADAPDQWPRAIALSRARPAIVRCALGLHPHYAVDYKESLDQELLRHARLPEVVAVGEIGLDYVKSAAPPDVQKQAFSRMLELARQCGLPVVIHCRGAYPDMLRLLADFYKVPPRAEGGVARRFHGVLHCFSGSKEEALAAVGLGFALGVDGPVTYPKNDGLRQAILAAGLENVVLETDSPYLPPQSSRGKRNDPRAIPEIAARVAQIFGISTEETAKRTTASALDLFRD